MLEWAILVTVAAVGLLVCVCCAAIVEIFRQLAELRVATNLDGQPISLNSRLDILPGEIEAATIGLPETIAHFPEAAVIFLHSRCGTCRAVAEIFRSGAPDPVWFVVPEADLNGSRTFEALDAVRDHVIADTDDGIASALGLDVTPAVVTLKYGLVESALGVSTPNQIVALLRSIDQPSTVGT